MCNRAIKYGKFECFEILVKENFPWDKIEVCTTAIRFGKVACLTRFHKSDYLVPNVNWIGLAAMYNFKCFKYLLSIGFSGEKRLFDVALKHDNVSCVKFFSNLNISIDPAVCSTAIKFNAVKCLKFFHKQKFEMPENPCVFAINHGAMKCFEYIYETGQHNVPDIITSLIKNNKAKFIDRFIVQFDGQFMDMSIKNDAVDCLKVFLAKTRSIPENICALIAQHDAYKCLDYIISIHIVKNSDIYEM